MAHTPSSLLLRARRAWAYAAHPEGRDRAPGLVSGLPSAQQALDIFAGEWTSAMPDASPRLRAGEMPLFDDERLLWAFERLGGVSGDRILELGPFEGGHSWTAQRLGAASVLAIEGNARAFLKCLVVKEVLHLDRVQFMLGDFVEYLETTTAQYDTCIASGVLYHLTDPARVLRAIGRVARRIVVWTHYYDADRVSRSKSAPRFRGTATLTAGDCEYIGYRYEYGASAWRATFAGGLQPYAHWMSRQALLDCLTRAGFDRIDIGTEEPDHMHGPCLTLAASQESRGAVASPDSRTPAPQ